MSYETFIGWRYLFPRRAERRRSLIVPLLVSLAGTGIFWYWFAHLTERTPLPVIGLILGIVFAIVFTLLFVFSVFTTVAICGVMLGVTALVTVLGVTSGFQEEFKDKVLGVNAHVIVMKWGTDFAEYKDVGKKISKMEGVTGVAPFVFGEMQAARGTTQATVLMKGIDPAASLRVLNVGGQIVEGSLGALEKTDSGIVIGRELAKKLHARVGDTVKLLSPLSTIDPSLLGKSGDLPRSGDFKVVGIFFAGFDEYDRRIVYLKLGDAQRLVGFGDVVSGVELSLSDRDRASTFKGELEKRLGEGPYRLIDWEELNHNLFTALRMQKFVISLFLTIIIVVAAFNIIASLTMIVTSKRREIAILKSMGAKEAGVARLFQVAGLLIGGVGVATGLGLGVLLCSIVQRYGYPLDPKIYLISQLPVHVRPAELVITAALTLGICFAATIYPALRASWVHPVEGLRYE